MHILLMVDLICLYIKLNTPMAANNMLYFLRCIMVCGQKINFIQNFCFNVFFHRRISLLRWLGLQEFARASGPLGVEQRCRRTAAAGSASCCSEISLND
jgi:hypothetical protein